ncbi:aldehyde dehydrogenase family protein [Bdellovibrio sp. HCB290]|uniref:aldehyde dehydrogenase family protein n=1 Tax=Bdellovibrio sp. HCB290 TaxID=3394356 RepID=UPI0039B3F883
MIEQLVLHQKNFATRSRNDHYQIRLAHLEKLESLVTDHQTEICKALYEDFKKPEVEALMSEVLPLLKELRFAKAKIRKWMKLKRVKTPTMLMGSKSFTRLEPLGACLIISPWNYPIYLTLSPLVSALAAGNGVTIKPSEYAPHCSRLMHGLLAKHFKAEQVAVIEGGPETTTELLKHPFDHVFFTGSTSVGRIVMRGASEHLSRVTLELGGKSPTIVDNSANLHEAAKKIAWAKFFNAGQTCVAPDYLFVQADVHDHFVRLLKTEIENSFGKNPEAVKSSASFARIINRKHTGRLKGLLENALANDTTILAGGEVDLDQHYVAPTLLDKIPPTAEIMNQEIFGPILPIMTFKDLSEVVSYINDNPKPLMIYLYSNSNFNLHMVMKETSSGSLSVNDSLISLMNPHLPFGGVGPSGLGSYHGEFGMETFSHKKAIFKQGWAGRFMKLLYPPYDSGKLSLLKSLIRFKL